MKKKLTANLGLKILAVLFSVVIWFIVVNINDPVDKTVFRNVPVEILNTEAVTSQGKVYEILDGTDVIDVTVWAKRSILDTLGKENVIATAEYGPELTAAVAKDNVFGCQFHPEKSGPVGLNILRAFCEM